MKTFDPMQQEMNAKLNFMANKASAKETIRTIDDVRKATDGIGLSAQLAEIKYERLLNQVEKMRDVSAKLSNIGNFVGAPLISYAKQYLDSVGYTTIASQKWMDANKKIEDSYLRIGKIAAETLVPLLEKAADLAEKVSKFAEENPEIVEGALKISLALMAASKALGVAANLKLFMGGKVAPALTGAKTAIGGFLGTAAGAGAATMVGGVAGGILGYNALAKALEWEKAGTIMGKTLTVLSFQAGKLFGPEVAAKWGLAVGRLTNQIEEATDATNKMGDQLKFTDNQMNLFMNYKDEEAQALTTYNKQRLDMITNFNSAMTSLEQNYQTQRANIVKSYYENERKIEQDYYKQRTQQARAYNLDVQRSEEDHQKEIRRMQEDHNRDMRGYAEDRDALGMVRAQRDYEIQRSRVEEDYGKMMARQHEDYARQLVEQEVNFIEQRKQRLEEFQIQLKEAKQQYDEQRKLMRQEHRKNLRDLQQQYNDERKQRRDNLIVALQEELNIKRAFNQAWIKELQAMLKYAKTVLPTPGSKEVGGYVSDGLYRLHNDEFVLNKQTTQALESMIGGNLTQQNVLRSIGGSGKNISIEANISVGSNPLAEFKLAMQRIAREELLSALGG